MLFRKTREGGAARFDRCQGAGAGSSLSPFVALPFGAVLMPLSLRGLSAPLLLLALARGAAATKAAGLSPEIDALHPPSPLAPGRRLRGHVIIRPEATLPVPSFGKAKGNSLVWRLTA